jgi:Glycosyl transferases group 1
VANALQTAARAAHKLQVASRPQTWADLGADVLLRARGTYERPPELSWPLPQEGLHRIVLRWPEAYAWPPQRAWLEPLRSGLSEFVRIDREWVQQPKSRGIVLLTLAVGPHSRPIAVDYSDYPEIDETLATNVPLYFKMQYLTGGYGISSVVPGGYPSSPGLYSLLGGARQLAANHPKQVVYGRFSPRNEARRRAVALLRAQQRFAFDGGFSMRRYGRHLADSAQSAVCLDMPGLGPLCFRLVDYLAVGCCIVGPRHDVSLHVPLEEGTHVSHVEPDLSNLIEVCDDLLEDETRRERLSAAAQDFFDRYLESRQLAAYYLHKILAHVS